MPNNLEDLEARAEALRELVVVDEIDLPSEVLPLINDLLAELKEVSNSNMKNRAEGLAMYEAYYEIKAERDELQTRLANYEDKEMWTGCGSGDCPHETAQGCADALVKALAKEIATTDELQERLDDVNNIHRKVEGFNDTYCLACSEPEARLLAPWPCRTHLAANPAPLEEPTYD